MTILSLKVFDGYTKICCFEPQNNDKEFKNFPFFTSRVYGLKGQPLRILFSDKNLLKRANSSLKSFNVRKIIPRGLYNTLEQDYK